MSFKVSACLVTVTHMFHVQQWNMLMHFCRGVTKTESWTWWLTVKWDSHVWQHDCHPVIFVALKKAIYFPQPLKMCYDFRACQSGREREGGREGEGAWTEREGTDCLHAHAGVFVHWACDRELALILLVVIGVSVRPHTLGCGCNCPWQAGL